MDKIPLYRQIERYLLDRIRSGTFPVDHQIPGEEQLARDFGVSRMTANKAICELVNEGYLLRRPGLGTFVTDRKAESSLLEIHNIADEVRSRGHAYSNTVVCCEAVKTDDEMSLKLEVRPGASIFHTLLVHRENDMPIQLEDRYVNPRWVPHYLDTDFTAHTPNEILVDACPISTMEHVVEAMLASERIADLLDMTLAEACLSMVRRTWSSGHLISYARLIHPGDRYKLRLAMEKANAPSTHKAAGENTTA